MGMLDGFARCWMERLEQGRRARKRTAVVQASAGAGEGASSGSGLGAGGRGRKRSRPFVGGGGRGGGRGTFVDSEVEESDESDSSAPASGAPERRAKPPRPNRAMAAGQPTLYPEAELSEDGAPSISYLRMRLSRPSSATPVVMEGDPVHLPPGTLSASSLYVGAAGEMPAWLFARTGATRAEVLTAAEAGLPAPWLDVSQVALAPTGRNMTRMEESSAVAGEAGKDAAAIASPTLAAPAPPQLAATSSTSSPHGKDEAGMPCAHAEPSGVAEPDASLSTAAAAAATKRTALWQMVHGGSTLELPPPAHDAARSCIFLPPLPLRVIGAYTASSDRILRPASGARSARLVAPAWMLTSSPPDLEEERRRELKQAKQASRAADKRSAVGAPMPSNAEQQLEQQQQPEEQPQEEQVEQPQLQPLEDQLQQPREKQAQQQHSGAPAHAHEAELPVLPRELLVEDPGVDQHALPGPSGHAAAPHPALAAPAALVPTSE